MQALMERIGDDPPERTGQTKSMPGFQGSEGHGGLFEIDQIGAAEVPAIRSPCPMPLGGLPHRSVLWGRHNAHGWMGADNKSNDHRVLTGTSQVARRVVQRVDHPAPFAISGGTQFFPDNLITGKSLQNHGADNCLGRSVDSADHAAISFSLYPPVSTAELAYGACRSPRSRDVHV